LSGRAEDGGEADVVDFGVGAPVGAGGDGDFIFAGKIIELRIAAEFAIESEHGVRDIGKFVSMDAGERAAGDIAGHVTAGTCGGKADGAKTIEDIGDGFDFDPVELDILANGDVGDSVAMFGGEIGDFVDLRRGEEAVGDADANHEVRHGLPFAACATHDALAVALGIDAPGTEVGGEPFGRNGRVAIASEGTKFVEVIPGVLGAFEALGALGFGFLGLERVGHGQKVSVMSFEFQVLNLEFKPPIKPN